MKRKNSFQFIISVLLGITMIMSSCSNLVDNGNIPVIVKQSDHPMFKVAGATFNEDFEQGSKTAYATAAIAFKTGSWNLNDALIGTSTSDRKSGAQSVRIRNTGILTMQFNDAKGVSTIDIKHGVFGTDGTSTWELYISTDSGSNWTKVGSTITSSSTTLATVTFTVNQSGNVRFEIRKITGGTNRINIDDVSIGDYSTTPPPSSNENLTLGNPSNADSTISTPNNYLMAKPQYCLSYNNSKHNPNWVSWRCGIEWLGSAARQDNFRADTTLPAGWYECGPSEFSGSGFDRGHMCPSADRTSSVADNSATFLMTNMVPQAPNNNEITWNNLEDYCRSLVSSGNELYIISGGYGQGGTGSSGYETTVGSGTWVPNETWKVIVVLPVGSNDASRVTTSTRVIAVLMPNDQTCNTKPWGNYRVSVDQIESLTGFDFLSQVPVSIQAVIEANVDSGPTI
jgi:endonuclease G